MDIKRDKTVPNKKCGDLKSEDKQMYFAKLQSQKLHAFYLGDTLNQLKLHIKFVLQS
jgi:hypothetical protein